MAPKACPAAIGMHSWSFFRIALLAVAITTGTTAQAMQVAVQHRQLPMHGSMVTRSATGTILARVEVAQTVQGDEVTLRRTYHFLDGSFDEDTTTFKQEGTFRLLRDHEVEKGPFFAKPVDFTVDAAAGTATSRTVDADGKVHVETEHISLPDDLANGLIGTLLLNVPANASPFRVDMLAPVNGGRLIRLLISPQGEQTFRMKGQVLKAAVFRIHPELGGILGMIAQPLGLQPKDVTVWILEGKVPEVVRIVGQLGGTGPQVTSELEDASFGN